MGSIIQNLCAVIVKYFRVCETCGTNVHIYYVYGYRQGSVFHSLFFMLLWIMINFKLHIKQLPIVYGPKTFIFPLITALQVSTAIRGSWVVTVWFNYDCNYYQWICLVCFLINGAVFKMSERQRNTWPGLLVTKYYYLIML